MTDRRREPFGVGRARNPDGHGHPAAVAPETVACGGKVPARADKPKPQFDGAAAARRSTRPTTYTATIETSCGTIEVELLARRSRPTAVNSFVFLAEQGLLRRAQTFHRIVEGFVIQGGDPLGTGTGGPGYEFDTDTIDRRGQLRRTGRARLRERTDRRQRESVLHHAGGGAQPRSSRNGQYTIFGSVTKGQDVLDAIAAVPTVAGPGPGEPSQPTEAVYIDSVTIDESARRVGYSRTTFGASIPTVTPRVSNTIAAVLTSAWMSTSGCGVKITTMSCAPIVAASSGNEALFVVADLAAGTNESW